MTTTAVSGLDLRGVFFFLTHAVPDQGSGISEAAAGNSAAEENTGGEERGFPPHSPQLPWRSGPQCLAQRNPILQTRLAWGMRSPKGKEELYGSGTGWEMVVGSSRIPHPEQQSLVAGVGCEGGQGNP